MYTGGVSDTASKGGAYEKDGAGGQQYGRSAARGNTRIQGDSHMSFLQGNDNYFNSNNKASLRAA